MGKLERRILATCLVLIVVGIIVASLMPDKDDRGPQLETILKSHEAEIAGDSKFVCSSAEEFKTIRRYVLDQNDVVAAGEEFDRALALGTCIKVIAGERFEVTDTTLGGLVQIRKSGSTESYWSDLDFLKPVEN